MDDNAFKQKQQKYNVLSSHEIDAKTQDCD